LFVYYLFSPRDSCVFDAFVGHVSDRSGNDANHSQQRAGAQISHLRVRERSASDWSKRRSAVHSSRPQANNLLSRSIDSSRCAASHPRTSSCDSASPFQTNQETHQVEINLDSINKKRMDSLKNNAIPVATLIEWYKIRDTFFGDNEVSQNILLALELASSCQHPDARWLAEACAGKDVKTREDSRRVFSALDQNDARALCFLWRCSFGDLEPLRRSAELGYAWAQAWMAWKTRGSEKFKFAELAASQGERNGLSLLGRCFRDGEGCEKDLDKAKENFLIASQLGDVWAMVELGKLLDESDPQRWLWRGRAAALGLSWSFLPYFAQQVELFKSGSGGAAAMFTIGQTLQGRVNDDAETILNDGYNFDYRIGPAKQAIAFYEAQIKATKDAMHAWTLVGIELKVVKDVRKLIAKLIWDARAEALYNVWQGREQEEQVEQEEEEEEGEEEEEEPKQTARKSANET
jgi:TPR repeat protein